MTQHCTPLRYPGGKQRLTPFVAELLACNDSIGAHYVEPYAGGAGVALELLLGGVVANIHINDSSYPIYAFWRSVLDRTDDFCALISTIPLDVEEWKHRRNVLQNPFDHDQFEVGFSTFYLNRCNRSGVLSGGLIGGLAQNGKWNMDARFPREELVRRVRAVATRGDCISVSNWDAERYILEYIPQLPLHTFVYCDPPYFDLSSRLYLSRYSRDDHSRIAEVIQQRLERKWVVSYDGVPEILALYKNRKKFVYDLQYNAARAYKGKEVFIFSDDVEVPDHSSLKYIDVAIAGCTSAIAATAR